MLFDTSSPGRKRVIRVVYSLLAVLFLVGFVGFGVGGNFSGGGILDALGITNSGGSSSGDSALEAQINDLQARVEKRPDDANALTTLVNLHFRQAVAKFSDNQNLEDARPDLEAALTAWEKYLKTDPKQPSVAAAPYAAQAYAALGDFKNAAKAQQYVIDANPKQIQQYLTLATYYYSDGDFANGEKAAKKAVALAPEKQKSKIKKTFARLETKARQQQKLAKAQAKAGGGEGQNLDNPFGSLDGSGSVPGASAP